MSISMATCGLRRGLLQARTIRKQRLHRDKRVEEPLSQCHGKDKEGGGIRIDERRVARVSVGETTGLRAQSGEAENQSSPTQGVNVSSKVNSLGPMPEISSYIE